MLASGQRWARTESAASWTRRRPPVLLTADTPHDNQPGGCSSHPRRCWRRFCWSLVSVEENRHSASVYLNTWSFNLLTTQWWNIPSLSSACTSAGIFHQPGSAILANATPNNACGVSYNRRPQAFPYKQVPVTLQWHYKPVLWKSVPLRFSGLPPQVEKNGWRWSCVYSFSCLFTNKMSLWSVCHFLLLFAPVLMMCCESCQISVGNKIGKN